MRATFRVFISFMLLINQISKRNVSAVIIRAHDKSSLEYQFLQGVTPSKININSNRNIINAITRLYAKYNVDKYNDAFRHLSYQACSRMICSRIDTTDYLMIVVIRRAKW